MDFTSSFLRFSREFLLISQYQTLICLFILCVIFYLLKLLQDREIDFSLRTLVGLVFGVVFGLSIYFISRDFSFQNLEPTKILWIQEFDHYVDFLSDVFLGFIKMLVLPIVGISIIKVLLEFDKEVSMGAFLRKSFFWILLGVGIAVLVGVILGIVFQLGSGMEVQKGDLNSREVENLLTILLNLIPSNVVVEMSRNNIIAYVIFCFFIGFGAQSVAKVEKLNESYKVFEQLIKFLHQLIMRITLFVVRFMPYAVVCMMIKVILSYGISAIVSAGSFIVLIYIAMVVMFIVHMILIALHGLNPFVYAKKSFSTLLFAFVSRSSVGTLPLTISTLQDKLGVSRGVANFIPSIGTTVGLHGCAGYFPGLVAIFVAYQLGVTIDLGFVVMVVIVGILGSLGIAGIPGSATMAASIMLTGIGFGSHFGLLAIILAIDPIIDMARTASNVSGAMVSSICVDKELKTLNMEQYKN